MIIFNSKETKDPRERKGKEKKDNGEKGECEEMRVDKKKYAINRRIRVKSLMNMWITMLIKIGE